MLKLRIITALLLIPIILLGLFYLPLFWFGWFSAFIFLGAAWEWTALIQIRSVYSRFAYLFAFLILCWFLGRLVSPPLILLLGILTWITLLYFIFNYSLFKRLWPLSKWLQLGLGLWILSVCWYALNFLRWQDNGISLILILFLLIWGADTGGYFFGRRWGKHKLAPTISPGKTMEGVLGGLVTALLLAICAAALLPISLKTYVGFLILATITIVISVAGDLFESMIKRQSGVKDSGQLLPGHGGLLDRIDSLISAAPVYAAGIYLLEYFNGYY